MKRLVSLHRHWFDRIVLQRPHRREGLAFDSAHKLFVEMPKRDVILFTVMICGLSENGFGKVALELFFQMIEERIEPTATTIATVSSISSQSKNFELGRIQHGFCLRKGFLNKEDIVLQTSLMDLYGKCGNLGYANKVFDKMTERNLVSWNSIINAFASQGSLEPRGEFRVIQGDQLPGC